VGAALWASAASTKHRTTTGPGPSAPCAQAMQSCSLNRVQQSTQHLRGLKHSHKHTTGGRRSGNGRSDTSFFSKSNNHASLWPQTGFVNLNKGHCINKLQHTSWGSSPLDDRIARKLNNELTSMLSAAYGCRIKHKKQQQTTMNANLRTFPTRSRFARHSRRSSSSSNRAAFDWAIFRAFAASDAVLAGPAPCNTKTRKENRGKCGGSIEHSTENTLRRRASLLVTSQAQKTS
jgi:hypothetical protein